ncbi:hypothetical protein LWI29_013847 [Acer saccharum]|uniref:AIPP2-like SPOC-like domain-containing protein n=1 Tax=Acer saccharum TaxID=4024 RepID=A0AA39V0Y4_ACESA|nr:hypothetical protein LWI29_013847 [Acer saccharum]
MKPSLLTTAWKTSGVAGGRDLKERVGGGESAATETDFNGVDSGVNKVTICLQCGVEGLSDALIYCYNCLVFAIHRYCLHVLLATFKDRVIWYCEDCESKVGKPSTVYNPLSFLPRTNDSNIIRTVKAAQSVSRLKKKSAVNRLKNKQERDVSGSFSKPEDHSGKISPCHYLEVHCYENHGKHQNSRRRRELDGRSSDEEAESLKTKTSWTTDCDNTSNPEQSRELHYDESNNKRLKRHVGLNGSSSDEDGESFKTKTSGTSVLPNIPQRGCYHHKQHIIEVLSSQNDNIDNEYQRQRGLVRGSSDEEIESVKCKTSQGASSDPSYIPKPISYIYAESIIEVHCCEKDEEDQRRRRRVLDRVTSDEEAEFVEAKTLPTSASQLSNIPNRSSYIPAEPIVKPIWNGCLSLGHENYGTVGLVAHLSSLACSKVVEEAKLLPWLLCLELLPRSDVWPQSFEKCGPSDDNIALFLFPKDEIEEMVYDSLVDDMISQDLAMNALVKNAELLVFTSKMLPSQFWRIQAKFYLWGVFRGKQASRVPNAVVPGEVKDLTNNFSCYAKTPVNSLSCSGS